MELYDIIFYLFAAITLVSAAIVVYSKNLVYSAFNLLFTFFGVAGIYVLLGADFIAVVQILVYVGGILILMLFGVMLTNKVVNVQIKAGAVNVIPASIGVLLLAGLLIYIMTTTGWTIQPAANPETTVFGLGKVLLTDYILIFELLAILLLVAMIGAATIARRDR